MAIKEFPVDGDVVGPASSTTNHVALFADGTGKVIKDGGVPASGSVTSVSVATANGFSGTVANATTTPAITIIAGAITPSTVNGMTITTNSGTIAVGNAKSVSFPASIVWSGTDGTTLTGPGETASLGYLNVPINSKSAAYEFIALDAGKQILHPVTDANNRQFTIPKNATVPYALGTCITVVNMSANDVTVIIDTDVLNYADVGPVTTITIPQFNMVTFDKLLAQAWLASGTAGVTTA